MRGLKSTLALLVVLIGLGAYAYFYVAKQDESASTQQEKVFPGVESDKIAELTVKSESGDVTTLKKDESNVWQMVAPAPAKAADIEVTGVTSAIQSVDIARVLEENATDLKQYGLDPARIEVSFKSADGKESGKLLIGQKTSTGGNVYAKRADQPRVLLIPAFNETTLNKSTFDLRDKTLVAFERSTVDSIEVTNDGKSFHLVKSGEDWKLTSPISSRADVTAADGLVSRLEMAQIKSIVTTNASADDLKKYGLDKPAATLVLGQGSARITVAIGGKAGDDVYVRDVSKPTVATIEQAFADDVKKGFEDYRQKELFNFRAFNATRLELTRGGKTVAFERVKATDGKADTWKRVTEPTVDVVDKDKIETLLTGLADIRAQSFTTSRVNTGLESPVLTVVAKYDEGKKEERVVFGKVGNDVYAGTVDPGAAKIEPTRLDEALKSLDELSK
ncbi:MAG TPA: DUF4340 domain-containing protein [Vicinamibacterales bacterium]|jgi:hypothetical protein|nr:DUF4340 domain-containing protein [Vicinamibacterales bacterium]